MRIGLGLVALSIVISANGCSAARLAAQSVRNRVPPVSRTSKEPGLSKDPIEVPSEPAVAANSAITLEVVDEALTADDAAETNSNLTSDDQRIAVSREANEPLPVIKLAPQSPVEAKSPSSSMERLIATLSDDDLPEQALPQRSVTDLSDRVRVDTLLGQSKKFLEIGRLEQARLSAVLAQELSESVQLDYSPEEERPIDLVRRIESQIEAVKIDGEAPAATAIAGLSDPESPAADGSETKSSIAEKDASRFARLRKDLTSLFRREKKPDSTNPVTSSPSATPSANSTESRADNEARVTVQQTSQTHSTRTRDSIVTANRSMALEVADDRQSEPVDDNTAEPSSIELNLATAEKRQAATDEQESSALDIRFNADSSTDSIPASLDTDDAAPVPTDFEITEAPGPAQFSKGSSERRSIIENPIPVEPSSFSFDWTLFYVGFAAFGALAFGAYRRGTT